MEYTKGPWTVGQPSGKTIFGKSDYIGNDEIFQRVAICDESGLYHQGFTVKALIEEEARANARLISTAPELYEALKRAIADIEELIDREEEAGRDCGDWEINLTDYRNIISRIEGD